MRLTGVGYRYPSAAARAVGDLDLVVPPGEVVLLTGPTGCGKSTVLRLCAGLLQRHGQGDFEGRIEVGGRDPASCAPAERVRRLGFVAQEPRDQLVAGRVDDELAFGMESAGWPADAMDAGIRELLGAIGLTVTGDRATTALSGGQMQRLCIGAALAAGGRALLLDEPLAQLDPDGATALLEAVRALADRGVAVLMVEHRLEAAVPFADRIVVMEDGRIVASGAAVDLAPGSPLLATCRRLGLTIPGMVDLVDRLGGLPGAVTAPEVEVRPPGPVLLDGRALTHTFDGSALALRGVDVVLRAGERVAVVGGNGAGKSTLLRALAGRTRGEVTCRGRLLAVPQDPDLALFARTVQEELAYGPRDVGFSRPAVEGRVRLAAEALSVGDLLDRPPQALSRGQRLRVAVAATLSCGPSVLLLDEPTAGQDHEQVERMMTALSGALADGALVFATHDLDLALRHATRVLLVHEGRILRDGRPEEVLDSLPPDVPLTLPPLAAWCLGRGIPPLPAAVLAERAEGTAGAAPSVARRPPRTPTPVPDEPAPPPGGLDPRARLALLLAVGVLAVCLEGPTALGVLAVASALPLLLLRVPARWWSRGAAVVALLVWSTAISQGLFYAEQPRVALLSLGPLTLWREGVVYGLAQSLRFVAVTLAGLAVAASTPSDRMHAALLALRVPFGLALMAAAALRFVPEVLEEARVVRHARAHRGRPAHRRAPWRWLALEVGLLRPVVARAWRRAQNLAESLDARGFDPLAPRTVRRPLRFRWLDGAAVASAISVALAVAGARVLYLLYVGEVVYLPELRPLYGFVRGWL